MILEVRDVRKWNDQQMGVTLYTHRHQMFVQMFNLLRNSVCGRGNNKEEGRSIDRVDELNACGT